MIEVWSASAMSGSESTVLIKQNSGEEIESTANAEVKITMSVIGSDVRFPITAKAIAVTIEVAVLILGYKNFGRALNLPTPDMTEWKDVISKLLFLSKVKSIIDLTCLLVRFLITAFPSLFPLEIPIRA